MAARLTRFSIRGYRSLRDVAIDLGESQVLIGPNGAGKSNLLSALRLVAHINTGSLAARVGSMGGASAVLFYGPKVTREIELRLDFARGAEEGGGNNCYEARLGFAAGDAFVFLEERVGFEAPGAHGCRWTSLGAGHKESRLEEAARQGDVTARTTRWLLNRLNYYHFHDTSDAAPIRTHSRLEDNRYLRSDGKNLAAYLYALETAADPESSAAWIRISEWVRRVAPFIKTLQPAKVGAGQHVQLDWTDERDELFGPHHLSDGTLRAIALFTALGQPSSRLPLFATIDEPELGLHPAAIALLAAVIEAAAPRCQTLLATQSPALLDHFAVEDVIVAERQQGETMLRRLDAAQLGAWLDDSKLSERYDQNVLGGRP